MNLTDKLSKLISDKNLNRKKFSDLSGIPYSTIDNWYKRGYDNMSISTLRALCTFFGVTMDSMAYDNKDIAYTADQDLNLTTEDAELIRKYNGLDASGRQMVDVVLDTALWQAESENTEKNLGKNEKTS